MPATYHFAYSGTDENGITQDATLLIDEDNEDDGIIYASALTERLTAFLRACGWAGALVTVK